MRHSFLSAALLLLAATGIAHADTLYSFANTVLDNPSGVANGVVTGTITINLATGTITGENFTSTITSGAAKGTYSFTSAPVVLAPNGNSYFLAAFNDGVGDTFNLYLPSTPGSGYDGTICLSTSPCGNSGMRVTFLNPATGASQTAVSGVLVANAPEPSSLFLFCTGILGFAGLARRHLFQASPSDPG